MDVGYLTHTSPSFSSSRGRSSATLILTSSPSCPPPPPSFTPDAATKSTRHPPRRLRQCRQCPDDLQVPSRSEPGRQRPRQVYGRPRPIFDQPGQGLAGMADQRACGRTGARERIGSTAPQRRSRQAVHSQRRKLFLLKWFGCVRLACIGITVSLSPVSLSSLVDKSTTHATTYKMHCSR